jgi:hypothetical protein
LVDSGSRGHTDNYERRNRKRLLCKKKIVPIENLIFSEKAGFNEMSISIYRINVIDSFDVRTPLIWKTVFNGFRFLFIFVHGYPISLSETLNE